MADVVCQVIGKPDQVEFIWSAGGGWFKPYVLDGIELTNFRELARTARKELETLVWNYHQGDDDAVHQGSLQLARVGHDLYNQVLRTGDRVAKDVRRWLVGLRDQDAVDSLEIVVDDAARDRETSVSVPWNVVYDERPNKVAFAEGRDDDRWRPFWALRYNLTCGRRVEPLRRLPIWNDPKTLMVIDPTVHRELEAEQRRRLDDFICSRELTPVGSRDALEQELGVGRPQLIYWLGHATPEYLLLGDDRIGPLDLLNLLQGDDDAERLVGTLAFLNACRTAETDRSGSFLEALHRCGFSGVIATEQQVLDNFANAFGLDFLEGFLDRGEPIGPLLRGLRGRVPLGLLYGAYCPPDIRVRRAGEVSPRARIVEGPRVAGVLMGAPAAAVEAPALPLPDQPYRSLLYYDREHRALFAGRNADVMRFALMLDQPNTRILVLQGESGSGKSSFLRAGVIPYLESECIGYRFLRDRRSTEPRDDAMAEDRHPVLFIQATNDLAGQLAQALLDYTAAPLTYPTPLGEPATIDLRRELEDVLGKSADFDVLRSALLADAPLLGKVLTALASRLPHALVVVIDQAEEVITLARTEADMANRDRALRMLQRLLDVLGDVKVIVSLRTEYYGRLIDRLRSGRRDVAGLREYLLTDFGRDELIEAIERPTSDTAIRYALEIPREKYGFRYADGVAQQIADGVLALRTQNRDSVLPLVQVICTQLYDRTPLRPGAVTLIEPEALRRIGGVAGGIATYVANTLQQISPSEADREAFRRTFTDLYVQQADGTLTTALVARDTLAAAWTGQAPFATMLDRAKAARLVREDVLRIEGDQERPYIRLGHDALAKVAATWHEELQREAQARELEERARREREELERMAQIRKTFLTIAVAVAVGFGILTAIAIVMGSHAASRSAELAKANTDLAVAKKNAESRSAELAKANTDLAVAKQNAESRSAELAKANTALAVAKQNADEARGKAEKQERLAGLRLQSIALSQASDLWRHDPARGLEILNDLRNFPRHDRDFAWGYYYKLCDRNRKTFKGHTSLVLSVAFTTDGRTLASGGADKTIMLWDAASGKARATLKGHTDWVNSVAFTPDGRTLASGGSDNTIMLWDTASGEASATLQGHADHVLFVSFTPDGRMLASGGADNTVMLWDAASGEARAILQGHSAPVWSVAFAPDGQTLASGSDDNTIKLWDVATGEARATLTGHTDWVQSVAFTPDGQTLASCSGTTIKLWDVATSQARATLTGHTGSVNSVAFTTDGQTLASGSGDNTIKLWDVTTGEARATLTGHTGSINSVAFTTDGQTLASGSEDDTIKLWDVDTREARATLTGHSEPVWSMAFTPDGKSLASGSGDTTIMLWDVATGKAHATFKEHTDWVRSVTFSPDGATLISSSSDRMIKLWDVVTHKARATLEGHTMWVNTVAFSPNGETLASGSEDHTIKLWDVDAREVRATLTGHASYVMSVAFGLDSKTLASGSADNTVVLWDVDAREARATLTGHTNWVRSVAFMPGGTTLASGSFDNTIKLWDTVTGKVRATLAGHSAPVWSVAFSPDGRTLASGSEDHTIKLWDAATGEARATLNGHTKGVTSVAFAPDGETLASGSLDGTIRLWDAAIGEARVAPTAYNGKGIRRVERGNDGIPTESDDRLHRLVAAPSGR